MYQFRDDGAEYTDANSYHVVSEYLGDEDTHPD